jgi:hypothetical protein
MECKQNGLPSFTNTILVPPFIQFLCSSTFLTYCYYRFVATVLHPAFVTSNASRHLEVRNNPETGELEIIRGKIIREYMSVPPYKGVAVPGQPQKQVGSSLVSPFPLKSRWK